MDVKFTTVSAALDEIQGLAASFRGDTEREGIFLRCAAAFLQEMESLRPPEEEDCRPEDLAMSQEEINRLAKELDERRKSRDH